LNAQQIIMEASQTISLKVGGNFIMIDPSGVTIYGTMVKINSGGFGTETGDPDIADAEDAYTSDNGQPGYLDKLAKQGTKSRSKKHRKLRSQHYVAPPRPGEDPKMAALRNSLKDSAAGRHALEVYDRYKVNSTFTPGIGGSYDPSNNTFNLDPNWGDYNQLAFVHEMNHAQTQNEGSKPDINNPDKAKYVDGMLQEEAHGDALSNQTYDQLSDAGKGTTNQPPNRAAYASGYQKGADAYKAAHPDARPEQIDAAGKGAGEQAILDDYRAGKVSPSDVGGVKQPPYPDYYGNAWDAAHPGAAGGH